MLPYDYLFQLKDLQYDYPDLSFFNSRDPKYRNIPNQQIFNRYNRYEMLWLINSLRRQWRLSSISDCRKIELLIRKFMPEEIKTQIAVADWLVLNWNSGLEAKIA